MSDLELVIIDSAEQLRRSAKMWDELWQSSSVALPTLQAELVAQWIDKFAFDSQVHIMAVRQGDSFVAALPLAGRKEKKVFSVGDLSTNCWSSNGELLIDRNADHRVVLDFLSEAVDTVPWPLIWLDFVQTGELHWKSMIDSLKSRGLSFAIHERYHIGQVRTIGSYTNYMSGRSKNHRRNLRKDYRRLEKTGPLNVMIHSEFANDEVDVLVREAFELENRGWKGAAGSSVLRSSGMLDFYILLARYLASNGQLRLAFLKHNDKPIAFELGWEAKGWHFSYKVGYDADYRTFAPGQLLRMKLIEDCFARTDCDFFDFQGPMNHALSCWSTQTYPISRLIVAPNRRISRTLLNGYKAFWPMIHRIKCQPCH